MRSLSGGGVKPLIVRGAYWPRCKARPIRRACGSDAISPATPRCEQHVEAARGLATVERRARDPFTAPARGELEMGRAVRPHLTPAVIPTPAA